MAPLDRTLFIAFSTITLLFATISVLCFRKAFKVAGERDGDLKMFFWAAGGVIGLIVAGMSLAYILLPILLHL